MRQGPNPRRKSEFEKIGENWGLSLFPELAGLGSVPNSSQARPLGQAERLDRNAPPETVVVNRVTAKRGQTSR